MEGINTSLKRDIDANMTTINEEIESIKVKIEESNYVRSHYVNRDKRSFIHSCQAEESKSNGMRWADIVKRNANTEESLIKVSKALNSAKDLTNFEEQERSLIFFNKVESKKDNFRDRYDEDEKFINELIRSLFCITLVLSNKPMKIIKKFMP